MPRFTCTCEYSFTYNLPLGDKDRQVSSNKHLLIAKGSEGREERGRKPGKRRRVTDVLVRNINYHSFCNGNWKKDGNKYINS